MATVISLIPDVAVEINEAPNAAIKKALVDATREFCRETMFWHESLAATDTVVDQADYTLTLPADSEIVDLVSIKYNENETLTPKTDAQLERMSDDWRTDTGDPYYYQRLGNATIKVIPIPQTVITDAIVVKAALQPAKTATTIDDKIIDDYGEYIIYGALGRLFRMSNKPWTDLNLSASYTAMFRSKFGEAKSRGTNERSRKTTRRVRYGGY